jgi:hypothetical protein
MIRHYTFDMYQHRSRFIKSQNASSTLAVNRFKNEKRWMEASINYDPRYPSRYLNGKCWWTIRGRYVYIQWNASRLFRYVPTEIQIKLNPILYWRGTNDVPESHHEYNRGVYQMYISWQNYLYHHYTAKHRCISILHLIYYDTYARVVFKVQYTCAMPFRGVNFVMS